MIWSCQGNSQNFLVSTLRGGIYKPEKQKLRFLEKEMLRFLREKVILNKMFAIQGNCHDKFKIGTIYV